MEKNYWAIHMGEKGIFTDIAYQNSFIGIGWNDLGRFLLKYRNFDRSKFFQKLDPIYKRVYGGNKIHRAIQIGQLFRFVNLMKIGDVVLMPKTDEGKVYIGFIDSDYFYKKENIGECDYYLRRKVRWTKILSISDLSQSLRYSLGSLLTVFGINDHQKEIEKLLSAEVAGEITSAEFVMESHLEDFLVENWKNLDLGKKYLIYKEGSELAQQYPTTVGKIDILAKSKDDKEWLVVELKMGGGSEVVGQILRYMGWVKENLAKKKETVRGLIITREIDEKLEYAVKAVENVSLMTYSVSFKLHSKK